MREESARKLRCVTVAFIVNWRGVKIDLSWNENFLQNGFDVKDGLFLPATN